MSFTALGAPARPRRMPGKRGPRKGADGAWPRPSRVAGKSAGWGHPARLGPPSPPLPDGPRTGRAGPVVGQGKGAKPGRATLKLAELPVCTLLHSQ